MMELGTYLRPLQRAVWLLVLVPVLTAAVTAAVLLGRMEPTYQAAIDVSLPSSGDMPAETDEFAADFTSAVQTARVVSAVERSTVADEEDITEGVEAERAEDDASFVSLTYTATSARDAQHVVRAVAVEAMRFVLQADIRAAQARHDLFMARLQELEKQAKGVPTSTSEEAAGMSPDQILVRQQQLTLEAALETKSELVSLQSWMNTVRAEAAQENVVVTEVEPAIAVLRRSAMHAGAALFLFSALLVSVELFRSRGETRQHGRETSTSPAGDEWQTGAEDRELLSSLPGGDAR